METNSIKNYNIYTRIPISFPKNDLNAIFYKGGFADNGSERMINT